MRTGTLISLGASAVLGAGALLVARIWLPQSSLSGAKRPATNIEATQPVVVAKSAIPYGSKLDAGRLEVVPFPAASVPAGAFSSISAAVNQPGGEPIVLTPISAKEPILPGQLSGGGAKPTVAAEISPGMRAFTIGINDVTGEGGHLLPGDRVDVILTYDLSQLAGGMPGGKRLLSEIILQDLKVLGVDLNADPSSTQAQVAHTATLEVSAQDAERLALAAQVGTLSLALRRTGGAAIAAVRPVNLADVGPLPPRPVQPRAILAGARRPGRGPARTPGGPHRGLVVVNGDAVTLVQVPFERAGA
ncbi:MAG: Flp pilus assembly protein CpaB [Caulobacteraceae bacterium]